MLQDMVHPQDQQLSIEEITSPLGAQILEFCESELFPETLQNPEVASTSHCCYDDLTAMKPPPVSASTPPVFDEDLLENDISASIDFTPSPYINNNNNNNQLLLDDHIAPPYTGPERWSTVGPPPGVVPVLATSYKEEFQLPSYMCLRASQPTIHDPMMPPFLPPFGVETNGIFAGSGLMHLGSDISHHELDFQGDNAALFLTDHNAMPRVFNCSTELQGLSSESQHLIHGGANATTSTNLASEISSLEDPTFKVGKLSVEERKRKIHRYLQKRNERNFSKKIKYACRKTLADSRPRVRGRFAKNDELGDINGTSNHEDETDEDVGLFANSIPHDHHIKVVVKEEDDVDSSDILAHISGVNSFKCNYPIQSWI